MTEPNLEQEITNIFITIDNYGTAEEARVDIRKLIANQVKEAYKKGYNDNARNCYCDSPGATEGVLPHKHLMDDGESHDIRPDIITTKREEV
jgi:hypothetical protein